MSLARSFRSALVSFCSLDSLLTSVGASSHKSNYSLPQSIREQESPSALVLSPPVKAGSCTIFTEALTRKMPMLSRRLQTSLSEKHHCCRRYDRVEGQGRAAHAAVQIRAEPRAQPAAACCARLHDEGAEVCSCAQVGYGNAPTVPSERSGVALTEDQRKLFTLPGKIHDTLQLNPKDPRLLG